MKGYKFSIKIWYVSVWNIANVVVELISTDDADDDSIIDDDDDVRLSADVKFIVIFLN